MGSRIVTNRIDASIEFSFQGKSYSPTATIDLDIMMEKSGTLPDLHRTLAIQHNIDTYSYLYEAMESYDIHYSNPTGLADQCIQNGQFDLACFEQLWREDRETRALANIAQNQLGINELAAEPKIKQALLEAYRLGKTAGSQSTPLSGE
ncbi:MAG: hypothetical protein OEX03_09875 [Gammaproteobacteria bacterium]|nr:hypothetical protein [Gammaproteobacteria bacterium]